MPRLTPGKQSNAIDRNAASPDRMRRNWQRLTQGAATDTLRVDGTTIGLNANGELSELHPLVINETPVGAIDGVNVTFTLANPPAANTLLLFVDGLLMHAGAGNDYTLSTNTITFLTGAIPETGDILLATYEK